MYLSADAVLRAISILRAKVHPFIGITFVACKHYGLSIGSMDDISIDSLTRAHMDEHHRIDRRSALYFQPFRSAAFWVAERYPSSGLQTVNTQTFGAVFMHTRATRNWGFEPLYLDRMEDILQGASRIPADALAVWLFKDANLGDISKYDDLVQRFFDEYNISDDEKSRIFSLRSLEDDPSAEEAFVSEPLEMNSVTRTLPEPPDAKAEGGRTIVSLRLANAGPAREMTLDFGPRLSIVTGDNGLGKSFLLDFAWWAATGMWADREALPQLDDPKIVPEVQYTLSGNGGRLFTYSAKFDQGNYAWVRQRGAMTVKALAVFSRADGSFAIAGLLPVSRTLS